MIKFKFFTLIALTIISLNLSAQLFEENKLSVGATYALDMEKIGLQIGGRLYFNDKFAFDVNAMYYNYGESYAYEINANPCYYFSSESFRPYAFLGFNISQTSIEILGQSFIGRKFGLNIGGGIEYSLEKISFYIEPKYTFGGFNQLNACAGIRVNL